MGRPGFLVVIVQRYPEGQWKVIEAQSDTPVGQSLEDCCTYFDASYCRHCERQTRRARGEPVEGSNDER